MKKLFATISTISGGMDMVSVRPFFLCFAAAISLAGCDWNFDWNKKDSEKDVKKIAAPVETKKYSAELELKGIARAEGEQGYSIQPSIYRQGSELTELADGGVRAVIPARASLSYQADAKKPLDISDFTHLACEVEFMGEKGACVFTIDSDSGQWSSSPIPVSRGINKVMLGVHKLWRSVDFDVRKIRAVRAGFPEEESKSEVILRNLKFIRDLRVITPSPAGVKLSEIGWDYNLLFTGNGETMELVRGDDGLWRMGLNQPVVRLARFGRDFSQTGGEELEAMGRDRFGEVELVEHNSIRVQFADNWYFTGFEGGVKAFSNRYIKWTYNIYGDGRCVISLEMDNSGGPELGKVELSLRSQRVGWYGVGVSGSMLDDSFIGPVGQWSFITVIGDKNRVEFFRNYLNPATIKPVLARKGVFAPGDSDRDGFDESQGCYYLAASSGGCKFEVICNQNAVVMPIFRIIGPWKKLPTVVVEGRRADKVVLLEDGSVLFELSGEYRKSFLVEVLGEVGR